jgi:hypothetical protein
MLVIRDILPLGLASSMIVDSTHLVFQTVYIERGESVHTINGRSLIRWPLFKLYLHAKASQLCTHHVRTRVGIRWSSGRSAWAGRRRFNYCSPVDLVELLP